MNADLKSQPFSDRKIPSHRSPAKIKFFAFLAPILLLTGATQLLPAQSLVPNLGAGGPQLAVLVEEVTRAGAPTGSSMMFPSSPGPLPAGGVLPVVGTVGAYTVDLSVALTTSPAPGIVISGSPGTITKTGTEPTRLHITIDGGLSSPQAANTLAHLALTGSTSGVCGVSFSAAVGYPAGGGDIAWTPFPSGIYLTRYYADEIEEYRLNQTIRQAGAVAIRTFLSADISTMGETLTLPSSGRAIVGAPLDELPLATFQPSSFDIVAIPSVEVVNGGRLSDHGSYTLPFRASEVETFNPVVGIVDLIDPTRSTCHVLTAPFLNYDMIPGSINGLNFRGEGLDTVVRHHETLAYLGGAAFDFDRSYVNDTTNEIVGSCMADDFLSFGVATYRRNGIQTNGWRIEATDEIPFSGDVGVDWVDGNSSLTITAKKEDGSVLRGVLRSLTAPVGIQVEIDTWQNIKPNEDWFDANLDEVADTFRRLAANPRSVPTASAIGASKTLVAYTDPNTGALDQIWNFPGINTFWAFSTDDGGIDLGGPSIDTFGESELTGHLDAEGKTWIIENSVFIDVGGDDFGLRDVRGNTRQYFDFRTGAGANVEFTPTGDFVECDVYTSKPGRYSFSHGPNNLLTNIAGAHGISCTNDPTSSTLYEHQGTSSHPITRGTAVDVTDALISSPAEIVINPWTPDGSKVLILPAAVDQEDFSGTEISIEVEDTIPTPSLRLEFEDSIATDGGVTFTFKWTSKPDRRYDIHRTTNPASGPPESWPIPSGMANLEATPPTNTFNINDIDLASDPFAVFVIIEKLAP